MYLKFLNRKKVSALESEGGRICFMSSFGSRLVCAGTQFLNVHLAAVHIKVVKVVNCKDDRKGGLMVSWVSAALARHNIPLMS